MSSHLDGVKLAVDLVNTGPTFGPEFVEELPDAETLAGFLASHGLESGTSSVSASDVHQLHAVRLALTTLFDATDDHDALDGLNLVLASTGAQPRLAAERNAGWRLYGQPAEQTWANIVGAASATGLATIILDSGRSRLGVCGEPSCAAVYIDDSKSATQRFCSHACAIRYSVTAQRARSGVHAHDGAMAETATVLVCSCGDSTQELTGLGDNPAERSRHRVHLALREAADRSKGNIVRTLDDGLVVVFPTTTADAVECAIAMHDRLGTIGQGRRLRIGLSVGEVTMDGGDTSGTPVLDAARLCELADPGEILLSEDMRRLVAVRQRSDFRWLRGAATCREGARFYRLRPRTQRTEQRGWDMVAAVDTDLVLPSGAEERGNASGPCG